MSKRKYVTEEQFEPVKNDVHRIVTNDLPHLKEKIHFMGWQMWLVVTLTLATLGSLLGILIQRL